MTLKLFALQILVLKWINKNFKNKDREVIFFTNKIKQIFLTADNDLNLIKEALLDIMNSTCAKFVPHTNEPDYAVFMGYKHPSQEKG